MLQQLMRNISKLMSPAAQKGLIKSNTLVNWKDLARRIEKARGWSSLDDLLIRDSKFNALVAKLAAERCASVATARATEDAINNFKNQCRSLNTTKYSSQN